MPESKFEENAKTVLYVTPSASLGGAEQCLLDVLKKANEQRDIRPHVLSLQDGPLIDKVRALNIPCDLCPMPNSLSRFGETKLRHLTGLLRLENIRFFFAVHRYLQKINAHIIHSNGMKAHVIAAVFLPRRTRLVWHFHEFIHSRVLAKFILPRLSRKIHAIIANSNAVARSARNHFPETPVSVVHNGIDLSVFSAGSGVVPEIDSLTGASKETHAIKVGLVATYAIWKGHDVFVEAAALIRRIHPELRIRYYIVGGPIYQTDASQVSRAELDRLTAKHGVTSEFSFIAFQENVAPIYRALDIVVHASTRPEPFGRTIVEAMACGRPVIVSKAGGAAELFEDGVDAIGVSPGDASALARAIATLSQDPALRAGLAKNAQRTVQRFSSSIFFGKILEVYSRLALTP